MDSKLNSLPFLDRLAVEITADASKHSLVVVLPNRRSQFLLMARLEARMGDNAYSIEFRTADQLMEELSGKQLIEPGEALVAFYRTYKQVEMKPQDFEDFSKWAVTFLSDMNDVDLHLGDMKALFHQISEYRSIELEQGPIEISFRSFWKQLPDYYEALKKEMNSIALGYRGMLYRTVAEMAEANDEKLEQFFLGKKVYWVGVVPGNRSEQRLLEWIREHADLEMYIDVDRFYIENTKHEAGRLFRSDSSLMAAKWKSDLLASNAYEVNIHPISGIMGQVLRAKDIVANIPVNEYEKTVIVLTDPTLFEPFLTVFHRQRDVLNISAGLSLKTTAIHKVVMAWVQVHASAIERDGETYFHQGVVMDFLRLPVVDRWFGGASVWEQIEPEIVNKNWKFISKNWMRKRLAEDLFADGAFDFLFEWEVSFSFVFERITLALKEWSKRSKELGFTHLDMLALPAYEQRLDLVFSQFNEVFVGTDLKVLRKFIHRQIGFSKVNIQQGNNDGIQVMSMLETRMVDFKHVIILGASDDSLPGNPVIATLIPFVHRVHHKLPTKQDTQALISYHFYRLIQRAQEIHLLYNTSSEAMTSGEPSRFILQINQEWAFRNKKVHIVSHADDGFIEAGAQKGLEIQKTPEVLASLDEALTAKISPSAINTYINSPLEFYFYYVLKIKEQEKVEEDMEASTFGSVVHDVLEKIYKPFIGHFVQPEKLKAELTRIPEMVENQFLEKFEISDLKQGLNYIQMELAKSYVTAFVKYDLAEMAENGRVKILHLEKRLSAKCSILGLDVHLMGFADRIDQRNNITRIIDYKTGKVTPTELRGPLSGIFFDPKYAKALQLACYKWAYMKETQSSEDEIMSCIYSCRSHLEGYMALDITNGAHDFLEGFELGLKGIVFEMKNPNQPFEHRSESKYTTF